MNKSINKLNSMANELGLVLWKPPKPKRQFACYTCTELKGMGDDVYTWKELIKHEHKLSNYQEITHLFE